MTYFNITLSNHLKTVTASSKQQNAPFSSRLVKL